MIISLIDAFPQDTPEVGAANELSPIPADDVFEEDTKQWSVNKCLKVAVKGKWLTKGENLDQLETGEVAKSLPGSNEFAWWLRQCCAKSAKFF